MNIPGAVGCLRFGVVRLPPLFRTFLPVETREVVVLAFGVLFANLGGILVESLLLTQRTSW